ncbi:MAG: ABC transporter permease subunit [Chloroflexota bacterium]
MNLPLFRHTFSANAVRLVFISAGLILMGVLMPVVFKTFGKEIGEFVDTVPVLAQLSNFGGANFFTLTGSIALGISHPFSLLLLGIMAIAFPALAIAGERDRGTLEVTLARPISRRGLYGTLYLAGLIFVGLLLATMLLASTITTYALGLGDELALGGMVQLWLAGWLLFVAFMSLAFFVSAMSDRAGPAVGIPAVFVLINYLSFAIGSIWPDAKWLEDYSMFNLLNAQQVLDTGIAAIDLLIMAAFSAIFVALALYLFPRRDIPSPS